MRYAVVSDLHANLQAVTAVFAAIDALQVDETVCLGDIVGYHANPNEVVELMRMRATHVITGNHDRAAVAAETPGYFSEGARAAIDWTRRHLDPGCREYLAGLPIARIIDARTLAVHGAAHPQPNDRVRLSNEAAAAASFAALEIQHPEIDLCFFGHIHLPLAYVWREGVVTTWRGSQLTLEPGARYLVNPGSVGQPRDGDPRAAFMTFDRDLRTLEFHRVSYDRDATRAQMRQAGLIARRPPLLLRAIRRLRHRK